MREPKGRPFIDEKEFIDCPKCGKRFNTWHASVKYVGPDWVDGYAYMNIYCPRCSYITKRRPLDWKEQDNGNIN